VIQQQLLTRANLLEVAEKFSIFASEPGLSATDIVERMTAATELTESQLGATRNDPGTVIFDVAFNASNPGMAARVTNEFVTLILQQNVEIRTGRASDTTQFFQNSVDELGAQLASLESEILLFKNRNADALPESLEFRRGQLTILQERLLQLERDELALQQSKATLEAAMLTQGGEAMLAEQMTPNQQALETLRNQLADQKAILSDKNPTIIALRSRIAALEEVVRNESEAASVVDGAVLPSTLSGQLDQVVARLQAIQDQRAAIDTENEKLQASITRTPEVEIKLNSLVRSYDNVKIQFASAQQKLSEAATGEQLELRQKGERFEVVEQPTVPDQPVSPNRLLIAFGGSALGLMLALGIGFLVEIMNRSVRRPADLIRKLDIQPFATIPYIETRGEVLRG
jgi:succinoglycan biosynthesis transport protein ExoP